MKVFLVDGTYELFRHFFGAPPSKNDAGEEIAAARGVVNSILQLIDDGALYIGVATDQVIESFRNDLYGPYKTGEGIDPVLWSQSPILEEGINALGVKLFPMIELEADDGLASVAVIANDDPRVEQVVIMTPDKDNHQCVTKDVRIVQYDRRNQKLIDYQGVIDKLGVTPESIPDYLALVGDTADGFPGLPGWGAKSTAAVLREYEHIENIPKEVADWKATVRGAGTLAANFKDNYEDAVLFKELATLRIDRSLITNVDELKWQGPTKDFAAFCERIKSPSTLAKAQELAAR